MRCGRLPAGLVALALALALAACGVPEESVTRTIAPSTVPYRLLDPRPPGPDLPAPAGPVRRGPEVYYLDRDERLVAQLQPVAATDAGSAAAEILTDLAAGPTEAQRARGLGSVFGPDADLRLAGLADGTATVEVVTGETVPPADRLPLAIGQVVLSVTSVDGVDRVLLVQDGAPVEAPLPGGERTSDPVTAADYLGLVVDPGVPATS